MDGTLIDTEKVYNVCWVQALKDFGYEMSREEALILRSFGRPHVLAFFRRRFGENFPYYEVRAHRGELMKAILDRDGIDLKPGAKELLSWLKERRVRCMVATATDISRTESYLLQTGIRPYFDRLISAAMVPEGKPSPDIYLLACREAGRKPGECFAVEDSPNGAKSAASAGCRVLFVPDLAAPDPETKSLCEGVFDNLFKVRDYLEARLPLKFMVSFPTTTDAMKLRMAADEKGLAGRLIPVPGDIKAGCGLGWCAPREAREGILAAMEEKKIRTDGTYEMIWD